MKMDDTFIVLVEVFLAIGIGLVTYHTSQIRNEVDLRISRAIKEFDEAEGRHKEMVRAESQEKYKELATWLREQEKTIIILNEKQKTQGKDLDELFNKLRHFKEKLDGK